MSKRNQAVNAFRQPIPNHTFHVVTERRGEFGSGLEEIIAVTTDSEGYFDFELTYEGFHADVYGGFPSITWSIPAQYYPKFGPYVTTIDKAKEEKTQDHVSILADPRHLKLEEVIWKLSKASCELSSKKPVEDVEKLLPALLAELEAKPELVTPVIKRLCNYATGDQSYDERAATLAIFSIADDNILPNTQENNKALTMAYMIIYIRDASGLGIDRTQSEQAKTRLSTLLLEKPALLSESDDLLEFVYKNAFGRISTQTFAGSSMTEHYQELKTYIKALVDNPTPNAAPQAAAVTGDKKKVEIEAGAA